MSKYTHLFFDLDHTLWDFETNAATTLSRLFVDFELEERGIQSAADFIGSYTKINDLMWADYRQNKISKEQLRTDRFLRTFAAFGIHDAELSAEVGDYYIHHTPRETQLLPHTLEVLTALQKQYELLIVTNGFAEVQDVKMNGSKLAPFFKHVITSEAVGVKKPGKEIFLHALKMAGTQRKNCLMIGDSLEADVIGARRIGIDQVYFNPHAKPHGEKVTHEIRSLDQLMTFL